MQSHLSPAVCHPFSPLLACLALVVRCRSRNRDAPSSHRNNTTQTPIHPAQLRIPSTAIQNNLTKPPTPIPSPSLSCSLPHCVVSTPILARRHLLGQAPSLPPPPPWLKLRHTDRSWKALVPQPKQQPTHSSSSEAAPLSVPPISLHTMRVILLASPCPGCTLYPRIPHPRRASTLVTHGAPPAPGPASPNPPPCHDATLLAAK